jgi:hypothetical protein
MFGDQGRNVVVGPGYFSWDFMAHKNVALGGTHQLQLRVEVFNLTNKVNFGTPDNRFGAANFGAISTAGAARQMQFGVRYSF